MALTDARSRVQAMAAAQVELNLDSWQNVTNMCASFLKETMTSITTATKATAITNNDSNHNTHKKTTKSTTAMNRDSNAVNSAACNPVDVGRVEPIALGEGCIEKNH